MLVYRCLHGLGPTYLARDLRKVSDLSQRSGLRSTASETLVVPRTRRTTIGDRAFVVAAARVWDNIPPSVTGAQSLITFRRALKTELFHQSFGLTW